LLRGASTSTASASYWSVTGGELNRALGLGATVSDVKENSADRFDVTSSGARGTIY
jgi:hypothetical protein